MTNAIDTLIRACRYNLDPLPALRAAERAVYDGGSLPWGSPEPRMVQRPADVARAWRDAEADSADYDSWRHGA